MIEKESISYFTSWYVWLGAEYSSEKDAFMYTSDGAPVVMNKWYKVSSYIKKDENRYSVFGVSQFTGWINSFNDQGKSFSICEPK